MNKQNKILIKRCLILILFGIAIVFGPIKIATTEGFDILNTIFIIIGSVIMLGGFSVLVNIILGIYKERITKNEL